MSLSAAYTPLETLLLFQALRVEGFNSHSVFTRISDQLQHITLVRSDPSYDGSRLSPDALRDLSLALLKDEVKSDLDRQLERDKLLQNGSLSPQSRKRKAPSPSLPTVHEASQHAHLIPQLVTRLYARYRGNAIREIREAEQRYTALAREITEIEGGKWDDRLQQQRVTSTAQSPHGNETHTQPKIDALINHESEQSNGTQHSRSSSTVAGHPQSHVTGPSPSGATQSSFAQVHGHPAHGQQPHPLPLPSVPSRALQPPLGNSFPPPSPVQARNSPGVQGTPIHQHPYGPHPLPHGQLAPAPGYGYPAMQSNAPNYYQQHPYIDQRGHYASLPPSQSAPHFSQQMPPGAPYNPQQYPPDARNVDRQRPKRPAGSQQMPGYAHGPSPYPEHSATAPSTGPRPTRPSNPRLVTDIIAALATPPRERRKPLWKSEHRPSPIQTGTPVPAPEVEPLSPVLRRSEPATRATRSTRNRSGTASEQPEEPDALPLPTRTRGRAHRERSPHSAVSSTADESARMTRSQSVSTAGALPVSDDRPASRGHVKLEPSTPAGLTEDTDTTHEAVSGGRMTRKRRGTLQSLQPLPQRRTRQHSLSGFADSFEDAHTPPPRPNTVVATRNFHKLSQTIMNDINSHKHASYFANPVRDRDAPGYSEIIKHPQQLKGIRTAIATGSRAVGAAAATLESPSVTDTPSKAAAAADAWSSTLELERSEELEPPKAIVNAAQLEKEVMRMFANAVMFNPGDDGLVADTREMFEDVEAKMREWRGADKDAAAEGGGGVDEEEGKVVKRRKL